MNRVAIVRACGLAWIAAIALAGCGSDSSPPTVDLTVAPAAITQGQSATLSWTSSDPAATCTAGGAWSGSQPASGSADVTPAASGSVAYTIDCGGTTKTATLTVNAASVYSATALIANRAGLGAQTVDPKLVNPWGVAFTATSPVWVANADSGTSTVYDGNGKPQPLASPRVVALAATPAGAFAPTGLVANLGAATSADFTVTAAGRSAAAVFIFAGEGGALAGWAPGVDAANAVTTYTDAGGAVYKGLAIGSNGTANHLYAADFRNGKIDVFDAAWQRQPAASFPFTNPALPAGYAPFGIQAIKNGPGGATRIHVAYARKASATADEETTGDGLGIVDVFDANGVFVKTLVAAGGRLNAPWGLALAPADFGTLSGALLVGNFGDGRVHGFDADTGRFVGTLTLPSGAPFALPGLWGIAFGNDNGNQPHNTLFYAAGINAEVDGVYGRLDLGATPPPLNAPPTVALAAPPAGPLSGTVTLGATASAPVRIAKVDFLANGTTLLGTATTAPYTLAWDTAAFAGTTVTLSARATDVDANVGTSSGVAVTVAAAAGAAPTLTQLQASVFTPRCSGCHGGGGASLPASQNLGSAAATHAALVGVASVEQPALLRVKPGDPASSYLVHKLEGGAGIVGSRMPLGGPFVDAATIDQIKAWIAAGAPNN